jgi:hypothetical protein
MRTLVPILTTMRAEAATFSRGESSVRCDLVVPMAFLPKNIRRKPIRHTLIRAPEATFRLSADALCRNQNGLVDILPAPERDRKVSHPSARKRRRAPGTR